MQEKTLDFNDELWIFQKEHHDKCTNCGKRFHYSDTTHLGFTFDNQPAYVCDNCSGLLKETVKRTFWMEKHFESPEPNERLWRYMDLAKFISIISSKQLYFPSAASFDDPFEGAKGIISRKPIWDKFYLDFLRDVASTIPGKDYSNVSSDEIEQTAQRLLKGLEIAGEKSTHSCFISCWYNNDYESEAMWKLYSTNVSNAVAIQTTAGQLYQALGRNPHIDIGKVKYIDLENQFTDINGPYWYKRKSFEYEKEVRAVYHSFQENTPGVSFPVDIEKLIENIYISPYAPQWFEEVVTSVASKYGINKPIIYSKIRDTPFF